jgi:hypothetical protein
MNDFCDLLGTPDAPVSKIAPVNTVFSIPQNQCYLGTPVVDYLLFRGQLLLQSILL